MSDDNFDCRDWARVNNMHVKYTSECHRENASSTAKSLKEIAPFESFFFTM
jgi:hypothetical protein